MVTSCSDWGETDWNTLKQAQPLNVCSGRGEGDSGHSCTQPSWGFPYYLACVWQVGFWDGEWRFSQDLKKSGFLQVCTLHNESHRNLIFEAGLMDNPLISEISRLSEQVTHSLCDGNLVIVCNAVHDLGERAHTSQLIRCVLGKQCSEHTYFQKFKYMLMPACFWLLCANRNIF